MSEHAFLSASSSHRWLHCPPSARLCEQFPEVASDYAAEGTQAHSLVEFRLKQALGMETENPLPDLTWCNSEMETCADEYVSYVMELYTQAKKNCPDPVVLIEQRLDYSRYVEDGFGTGDCILVADGLLEVIDFKYGRGVRVEAEKNPQMMLYALGALELFEGLYGIEEITMTIFQPRVANLSTFSMTKKDLLAWAEEVLEPAAKLAFAGIGEFSSGDWCVFCKAKAECRARAEANLEMARHEFKLPPLLHDEEVAEILGQVDELLAWASDFKTHALKAAVSGKVWQGYKLVEGRSNRRFTDEQAVAAAVAQAGFEPYKEKLLGITELEKQLGKTRFNELLQGYIIKPRGKPTLVPESDKRAAMNNARNDFEAEAENK